VTFEVPPPPEEVAPLAVSLEEDDPAEQDIMVKENKNTIADAKYDDFPVISLTSQLRI
jgi:hypothetical protein